MNRAMETALDSLIGVVHLTFGMLVVGRVLNSRTLMQIEARARYLPTPALRQAFNEAGYDPVGSVG